MLVAMKASKNPTNKRVCNLPILNYNYTAKYENFQNKAQKSEKS